MSSQFIVDNLDKELDDAVDNYFGISGGDNNDSGYDSDTEDDSDMDIKDQNGQELDEDLEEDIVGIDLGTTNSCVGIWRNNNLEIIPDSYGNRTIPSAVGFTNRSKYVGRTAKNQIEMNPENTFYEVKRLIGRKYDDPVIENEKEFLSYDIGKDKNNEIILKPKLSGRKASYTPEEISAYILLELKLMAEDYLNKHVSKAVITVPAYFNDSQREATKDAAKIAGLECVRIINEPTAAALAYGLEKLSIDKQLDINVIVYDLGGCLQP